MSGGVLAVLPGDVRDPARPSGGNVYDQRICAGLGLRELPVPGTWPTPSDDARWELARILAGVPDGATVLLDGLVACGVPEIVVPEAGRLRLVVLVHLPLGEENSALAAGERAVLLAAERSGAVVATSAWTARRITEVHGVGRVAVVIPGTDPARRARGGPGEVLCVGSLTAAKGQDVLVTALGRLRNRSWRCRLVGAESRSPEFVGRLGVGGRGAAGGDGSCGGRIVRTGPLAGRALEAAYRAAGLLVLPSRTEAFGMVVLEALARGIPVIASDVGGVREALGTVDGGTLPGLLVAPGDPVALSAALARWFDDPTLRDRLHRAALLRRSAVPTWGDTCAALAGVLAGVGHGIGVRA